MYLNFDYFGAPCLASSALNVRCLTLIRIPPLILNCHIFFKTDAYVLRLTFICFYRVYLIDFVTSSLPPNSVTHGCMKGTFHNK